MNKSILDQGWFEFRCQLDYKLAWNGGWLVGVPPQYTSRTCPCCGQVSADNRQRQAQLLCVDCGFEENADLKGIQMWDVTIPRPCRGRLEDAEARSLAWPADHKSIAFVKA